MITLTQPPRRDSAETAGTGIEPPRTGTRGDPVRARSRAGSL